MSLDDKKLERLLRERKLKSGEVSALIDMIRNPPVVSHRKRGVCVDGDCVSVGVVSDTHCFCKDFRKDWLDAAYSFFDRVKTDFNLHVGDVTDGEFMRRGHVYDLLVHGVDETVDRLVSDYPVSRVPTYFILGNHDESFMRRSGVDIGVQLELRREDLVYLGGREADIHTGPDEKTIIRLSHPGKGIAYALSYQVQKYIDGVSGGKKPHVLLVGHYHKAEYMFYRNIHAFQAGTLCAQTEWMRAMNISAHPGFWVLRLFVKGGGGIVRINQEFVPFYE